MFNASGRAIQTVLGKAGLPFPALVTPYVFATQCPVDADSHYLLND